MRICRSGRTRHFDSRYHGIAPRIVGNSGSYFSRNNSLGRKVAMSDTWSETVRNVLRGFFPTLIHRACEFAPKGFPRWSNLARDNGVLQTGACTAHARAAVPTTRQQTTRSSLRHHQNS